MLTRNKNARGKSVMKITFTLYLDNVTEEVNKLIFLDMSKTCHNLETTMTS